MIDPVPIIEVEGVELPTPISWTLSVDLLDPCDELTASFPLFVRPDELPLDGRVTLRLGTATVFTGRIDDRDYTADDTWSIRCRDTCAKLVDESVPGAGWTIGRGAVEPELLRIITPWFGTIRYSNASDRILRRGSRRGLAAVGREPVSAKQLRAVGMYIDAGTTRWAALQRFLEPLGYLAWSSGDGTALIVAAPNYSQSPQYRFVKRPSGSNVLSMSASRSIGERYQQIVVSGTHLAPGAIRIQPVTLPGQKKKKYVVNRSLGVATDTSGDFRSDKRLFVIEESVYPKEAQQRAERLLGQQMAKASEISVTVPGLGQEIEPGAFVLYAPDTLAEVRLDTAVDSNSDRAYTVIDAVYYITAVNFNSGPDGSRTEMKLIPKGSIIV